jgi:hypothetical protein
MPTSGNGWRGIAWADTFAIAVGPDACATSMVV